MKKHQQLPSEFEELVKNAKEVLLEQLKIVRKQQNQEFELQDLLKHLIIEKETELLRKLFKHQTLWRIQVEETFVEDILQRIEQSLDILVYLKIIADGYFCPQSPLTQTQSVPIQSLQLLQNYFECQTPEHYNISFEVGVAKKPRVKKQKITEMRFLHQITFIGFKVDKKQYDTLERIKDYHYNLRFDPYRSNLNEIVCESATVIQKKIKQFYWEQQLFRWDEESRCGEFQFLYPVGDFKCSKWLPNQIRSISADDQKFQQLIFNNDLQKWVNPDQILKVNQDEQKPQTQQQNKYLLDQYADFDSAAKIIEIMQGLPEFTIMITNQERNVIASQTNSLVIGRSGTGKTTCCILRLFALQTLLKIRQRLFNQDNEYMLMDGDNKIGLHCVFTTLNPVLIGEVRNYYHKLLFHVQEQIQKNQKQHPDQFENPNSQTGNELNLTQISNVLQEESILLQDTPTQETLEDDDQDKIDAIKSFDQISEKQFPIFLSINKLLQLIDASLQEPFFQQDKLKKNAGKLGRAGWNTGNAVKIAEQFKSQKQFNIIGINSFDQIDGKIQDEEFTMMDFEEQDNKSKQYLESEGQAVLEFVEVDYNFFSKRFWPKVNKNRQKQEIDLQTFPTLLWTQIYSFIKGSQYSYSYPLQYLPRFAYYQINPSSLSPQYLKLIYDYFLEYEKWKLSLGLFDMMDLVNYIICQIDQGKWCSVPIHYMFVDEVQDLPHAVLQLFSRLIEQGFFYCGDTAQNIVQGVGFRFQDIKNVLKGSMDSNQQNFRTVGLTTNFRSHNNILQLANSVVTLIELLFPKAIDRLNKEISDLKGPLPLIIEENDIKSLIKLFENGIRTQGQIDQTIPIEFGCNQVVLVRSEEEKENIPKILEGSQLLTIFESKGLEFEDVILYNFFSESNLTLQQWELLNYLFVEELEMDSDTYNSKITKNPKQLNLQSDEILANSFLTPQQYQQQQKTFVIKKLRLSPAIQAIDLKSFSALSDELKQLYVAITRAKHRIIIFDNQLPKRAALQKLWKELGIIQIFDQNHSLQLEQNLFKTNTPQEWRAAGKKMFANKHYEQAAKCFRFSGDEEWEIKSLAYTNAQKGEKKYFEMQNQLELNENINSFSQVRYTAEQQVEELRASSESFFIIAGDQFLHCKLFSQAAACYFSGQQFKKSLKYYIISKRWNEAGEAALKIGMLDVAGLLFLKGKKYLKSVETFKVFNKFICLFLISQIKFAISDVYLQIVLELLPKVLKDSYDYESNQPNSNCNFSIIEENNKLFEEEFQLQLKIINMEDQKINIKNKKDLFQTITFYIKLFSFELMKILSKVFINYPLLPLSETLWTPKMKNEQHYFILNVLEYFDLTHIELFVLDFIGSDERDSYLISCLYQISPLYQPCISLQELIKDQKLTIQQQEQIKFQASKKHTSAQKFISLISLQKLKNPHLTIFSIIQLGFYELIAMHASKEITLNNQNSYEQIQILSNLHSVFKDPFIQSAIQFMSGDKEIYQNRFLYLLSQYLRLLQGNLNLSDQFQKEKSQFNFKFLQLEKVNKQYQDNQVISSQQIHEFVGLIDDWKSKYYYQNLESMTILLTLPLQQTNQNQYQELLKINYKDFQILITELQEIVDLFKYNRGIHIQLSTLLCIQSIFQISLANSETFKFISQTYMIVHRQSIIFQYLANNYSKQNYQCFQIDAKGDYFLFSSILVVQKIQSIYKQFLTKYVFDYCVQLTKQNNNKPFILDFYVYCIKKSRNESLKENNNQMFEMTQSNLTLQNCLFSQFCEQMFKAVYYIQFEENQDWQIFYDLATQYFAKALTDQTLQQMHIHILTAINSLQLANCYDKSYEFIKDLIKAREQNQKRLGAQQHELNLLHPFLNINQLQYYQYYIDYLMTSSICVSIKTISNYILFEKGLEQILFFEQRLRDLTFCVLTYIICITFKQINTQRTTQSELLLHLYLLNKLQEADAQLFQENISVIIPEKMFMFLTNSKQEYNILQDKWQSNNEIFIQLIDIIFNLAQSGEFNAFILIVSIIINLKSIPIYLAQKLDDFHPTALELDILTFLKYNFKTPSTLPSKLQVLQKNFKIFENFKLIEIHVTPITNQKYEQQEKHIQKIQNARAQIQYKNKKGLGAQLYGQQKMYFKSLYFGMRIVTFKPLMYKDNEIITFNDHLVRQEQLQAIYDEFNLVRSQLFEILYTKQLQKSVNFLSIMQELEKLEEQEQILDSQLGYLKQYGLQNKERDAINYQYYQDNIENSKMQIEQWIKDNNQLSGKLKDITQKISQNQQKRTTAVFLINRRNFAKKK